MRTTVIFRVQGSTEAELWERANATLASFFGERHEAQVKLEARPLVEALASDEVTLWEGEVEARS